MATGKIKTLFSDIERTEALFPKTKISAVSDEEGIGLDAILDNMVHASELIEDIATVPVNVDTLGGRPAEDYATKVYVDGKIEDLGAVKITIALEDGILKFN